MAELPQPLAVFDDCLDGSSDSEYEDRVSAEALVSDSDDLPDSAAALLGAYAQLTKTISRIEEEKPHDRLVSAEAALTQTTCQLNEAVQRVQKLELEKMKQEQKLHEKEASHADMLLGARHHAQAVATAAQAALDAQHAYSCTLSELVVLSNRQTAEARAVEALKHLIAMLNGAQTREMQCVKAMYERREPWPCATPLPAPPAAAASAAGAGAGGTVPAAQVLVPGLLMPGAVNPTPPATGTGPTVGPAPAPGNGMGAPGAGNACQALRALVDAGPTPAGRASTSSTNSSSTSSTSTSSCAAPTTAQAARASNGTAAGAAPANASNGGNGGGAGASTAGAGAGYPLAFTTSFRVEDLWADTEEQSLTKECAGLAPTLASLLAQRHQVSRAHELLELALDEFKQVQVEVVRVVGAHALGLAPYHPLIQEAEAARVREVEAASAAAAGAMMVKMSSLGRGNPGAGGGGGAFAAGDRAAGAGAVTAAVAATGFPGSSGLGGVGVDSRGSSSVPSSTGHSPVVGSPPKEHPGAIASLLSLISGHGNNSNNQGKGGASKGSSPPNSTNGGSPSAAVGNAAAGAAGSAHAEGNGGSPSAAAAAAAAAACTLHLLDPVQHASSSGNSHGGQGAGAGGHGQERSRKSGLGSCFGVNTDGASPAQAGLQGPEGLVRGGLSTDPSSHLDLFETCIGSDSAKQEALIGALRTCQTAANWCKDAYQQRPGPLLIKLLPMVTDASFIAAELKNDVPYGRLRQSKLLSLLDRTLHLVEGLQRATAELEAELQGPGGLCAQVDEVQRAYTTKRAHLEQLRRQLLHRAVIMRRGSLGLISQGSSSGRLETMPSGASRASSSRNGTPRGAERAERDRVTGSSPLSHASSPAAPAAGAAAPAAEGAAAAPAAGGSEGAGASEAGGSLIASVGTAAAAAPAAAQAQAPPVAPSENRVSSTPPQECSLSQLCVQAAGQAQAALGAYKRADALMRQHSPAAAAAAAAAFCSVFAGGGTSTTIVGPGFGAAGSTGGCGGPAAGQAMVLGVTDGAGGQGDEAGGRFLPVAPSQVALAVATAGVGQPNHGLSASGGCGGGGDCSGSAVLGAGAQPRAIPRAD